MKKLIYLLSCIFIISSCGPSESEKAAAEKAKQDSIVKATEDATKAQMAAQQAMKDSMENAMKAASAQAQPAAPAEPAKPSGGAKKAETKAATAPAPKMSEATKAQIDELNGQIKGWEKEKAKQDGIIDEANQFFSSTIPCGKGGAHGKYKRKESDGNEVCSTKYGDMYYDYQQKSNAATGYKDSMNKKIAEAKDKIASLQK